VRPLGMEKQDWDRLKKSIAKYKSGNTP